MMRYTKLLLPSGPTYASIEERNGVLFASGAIVGPEEDPIPPSDFIAAPLDQFRLLPPVRPSKIVCVGRNYKDHAAELGNEVPKEPLLFLKPPSALLPSGETVIKPHICQRLDFEGELGIVIGKRCRSLSAADDLRSYIRGYVLVNDITARDIQKSDGQWTRGKGFDTFCPVGPIVSDEIDPAFGAPITVTTQLNGEPRQKGSTADLIFPIAELLVYITACMTLEPGDLVPTGTPAGVGPMQPGDLITMQIAGLGTLSNRIAAG
jgi:2-keto-4-pentenoate hydratase/2-oxohepta-3-ene-1,7-dioic acid hydratase in catechol pathway